MCYPPSQPTQHHCCSGTQPTVQSPSPLLSPSPRVPPNSTHTDSGSALAFGSYTDKKCSVHYVQTIPLCPQLSFPGADLSLLWGRRGSTGPTPPKPPRLEFCKHPLIVLNRSFWEPQSLSVAGKGNIPKSDYHDSPATVLHSSQLHICSAL